MPRDALVFSLLTIMFWGVGSALDKYSAGAFPSALAYVSLRSALIGTVFITYGLASGTCAQLAAVPRWALWAAVIGSVVGPILGQVCYFAAIRAGEASRVIPVTATYPLIAAVLAIIFLGERLTWSKGLGAVCVVLGILLLSGVFNGVESADR